MNKNVKCIHIATISGRDEVMCEAHFKGDCIGVNCPHYKRHVFIPEICEAACCTEESEKNYRGIAPSRVPIELWRRISLE